MSSLHHVHSWVRLQVQKGRRKVPVERGGEIMFICAHPDCSSMKPRSQIVGKSSSCPSCGNAFVITKEKARRAKPMCIDCSNTNESKSLKEARELIRETIDKGLGLDELFNPSLKEPSPDA